MCLFWPPNRCSAITKVAERRLAFVNIAIRGNKNAGENCLSDVVIFSAHRERRTAPKDRHYAVVCNDS